SARSVKRTVHRMGPAWPSAAHTTAEFRGARRCSPVEVDPADAPDVTRPRRTDTRRRSRRFWFALGAIVMVALGLRVAYVLTVTRYDSGFYDALYYTSTA